MWPAVCSRAVRRHGGTWRLTHLEPHGLSWARVRRRYPPLTRQHVHDEQPATALSIFFELLIVHGNAFAAVRDLHAQHRPAQRYPYRDRPATVQHCVCHYFAGHQDNVFQ